MRNTTSKGTTLILPFPKSKFFEYFKKSFPLEVFPGGIHELVLSMLEAETAEQFVFSVMQIIEDHLSELQDYVTDPTFTDRYQSHINQEIWQVLLVSFYDDFEPIVSDIFGDDYPTQFTSLGYNTKSGVHISVDKK